MQIDPVECVEVELENDPTKPKTKWLIHRLTYSDSRAVEGLVGARPVRGLAVFGRVHPSRPREEIEAESKLPKPERDRLVAERIDAAMKRRAELDPDDLDAYDEAIDWLERYDFAVCRFGVAAVDGERVGDVAKLLDEMRPTESVRVVVGELAGKITRLAELDDEKKRPSPSPHG